MLNKIIILLFFATLTTEIFAHKNIKIVGGTETAPEDYPWTVAIYISDVNNEKFLCGGSLIRPDWVLTANHCLIDQEPGNLTVILGRHNLQDPEIGDKIKVKKFIMHNELLNDIALIQLEHTTTRPTIDYITSDLSDLIKPGTLATVVGYGRSSEAGARTERLFSVDVPIVSNEECRKSYSPIGIEINQSMLCAGLYEGGKDACDGDSGGPLMVADSTGKKYLAGIVSFGEGCARPIYYGVYTNVIEFSSWIDFTINSL